MPDTQTVQENAPEHGVLQIQTAASPARAERTQGVTDTIDPGSIDPGSISSGSQASVNATPQPAEAPQARW